jgi:hypothetical protein
MSSFDFEELRPDLPVQEICGCGGKPLPGLRGPGRGKQGGHRR